MAELWENDPDNLLELSFVHHPAHRPCALGAVEAALAEINEGYPQHPRTDAKRRARASRIHQKLTDLSIIETAITEYLTRAERDRQADGSASLPVKAVADEVEALARQAQKLLTQIEAMKRALLYAETGDNGREVADSVDTAQGYTVDGWRGLRLAAEALTAAARYMPDMPKGRGGAISHLRFTPEVALLKKLEAIWNVNGLKTGSGDAGDGLDVFMRHVLQAHDPKSAADADWFDDLRAKARREAQKLSLST